VPPRKKKVNYSNAGSGKKRAAPPAPAAPETTYVPTTVVAIDLHAGAGREGLKLGDRVRIIGTGLYSGEEAIIEKFAGTAIPAAIVRTEAGRTRQVRTIDLEPVTRQN
jgi:hypothetical protein